LKASAVEGNCERTRRDWHTIEKLLRQCTVVLHKHRIATPIGFFATFFQTYALVTQLLVFTSVSSGQHLDPFDQQDDNFVFHANAVQQLALPGP
jgi:hypothetical protein